VTDISVEGIRQRFRDEVTMLQEEPAFQWGAGKAICAVDDAGLPAVQVAVGNVPLDYDLWQGLRNPAVVGRHPAGLRELWEFHANRRKRKVDESGRATIFQLPLPFADAKQTYRRAVLVSAMLPFAPDVMARYADVVLANRGGASHLFRRMYEESNRLIDTATSRVAMALGTRDNVVIPMHNDNVEALSREAIPATRQGVSHGPSKGGNYPQKSLAVLLGLGQFGISRIVFRDVVDGGRVRRFVGPLRSIVLFDDASLVTDGEAGIVHPTAAWRDYLFTLFDFAVTDPDVNRGRFCTYLPLDDEGCWKCVGCCPSGAQANSAPTARGDYAATVRQQRHRFWEGRLQFDAARCCEDRGQMQTLFPEWSCARCVTICAVAGTRRPDAVAHFNAQRRALTS
jgi:hypothetical protein